MACRRINPPFDARTRGILLHTTRKTPREVRASRKRRALTRERGWQTQTGGGELEKCEGRLQGGCGQPQVRNGILGRGAAASFSQAQPEAEAAADDDGKFRARIARKRKRKLVPASPSRELKILVKYIILHALHGVRDRPNHRGSHVRTIGRLAQVRLYALRSGASLRSKRKRKARAKSFSGIVAP